MVKQVKITSTKITPFGNNPFECVWSPDGSKLYVSGEPALGIIERDNEWKLTFSNHFTHSKPISCVMFINENVLCTAGLDKQIRFWDLSAKIQIFFVNSQDYIYSIQYCQKVSFCTLP